MNELRPQPGAQELFLSIDADIIFYGGGAGGGKTHGLLLENLRHVRNPEMGSVIFRKTYPEIMSEGGLWDASSRLFTHFYAKPNSSSITWNFPSGAAVSFGHIQYDKDVYKYMGSEIPLICFDELTRFSWFQFQYMLSRNRSTCGVRPYIRATCNPDKNSWVRKFIDWYIGADGYPIKERGGVIRYFIIEDDEVKWSDSPDSFGENSRFAKSFTFIPALLDDNKILMEKDPGYEANLMALSKVERERLRFGNWNIEPVSGEIFKRAWFPIIRAEPRDFIKVIRYWDRASSTKDRADFTAGVKMGVRQDGSFVVIHVEHFKGRPKEVWSTIKNLAAQDGIQCEVGLEKDPGQAGVVEVDLLISQLAGFDARAYPALVDKVTRANPVSAQCEIGNVSLLEGEWNEGFLRELEAFPDGAHDDQVDAFSGAFNVINSNKTGIFTDEMAQSEEIKEKVEW